MQLFININQQSCALRMSSERLGPHYGSNDGKSSHCSRSTDPTHKQMVAGKHVSISSNRSFQTHLVK